MEIPEGVWVVITIIQLFKYLYFTVISIAVDVLLL